MYYTLGEMLENELELYHICKLISGDVGILQRMDEKVLDEIIAKIRNGQYVTSDADIFWQLLGQYGTMLSQSFIFNNFIELHDHAYFMGNMVFDENIVVCFAHIINWHIYGKSFQMTEDIFFEHAHVIPFECIDKSINAWANPWTASDKLRSWVILQGKQWE